MGEIQNGRKQLAHNSHRSIAILKSSWEHVTGSLISPGSGSPSLLALLPGRLTASLSQSSFPVRNGLYLELNSFSACVLP